MNNSDSQSDKRHQFYSINENDDGTVDVILRPTVYPLTTPEGQTDYDISIIIVRGIIPWDGIEDDIRARYSSWCQTGETVYL